MFSETGLPVDGVLGNQLSALAETHPPRMIPFVPNDVLVYCGSIGIYAETHGHCIRASLNKALQEEERVKKESDAHDVADPDYDSLADKGC